VIVYISSNGKQNNAVIMFLNGTKTNKGTIPRRRNTMIQKRIDGKTWISIEEIEKAVLAVSKIYPSVVDTVFTDILAELYIDYKKRDQSKQGDERG